MISGPTVAALLIPSAHEVLPLSNFASAMPDGHWEPAPILHRCGSWSSRSISQDREESIGDESPLGMRAEPILRSSIFPIVC